MGIHGRNKNLGNYWGPDIRREIRGDNVSEKMIRANQQHLTATGYFAWLYQSIERNNLCSCVNAQSGQASDNKCYTCYGTARIGGYERYGFDTQFFSSSDLDELTLVNVEQNLKRTPKRLKLKTGETSGTIVSEKFRVENPLLAPFSFRFNAYTPDSQNSMKLVEFAINDEVSWRDIDELSNLKMHYGDLRFKVTLTRIGSTIQSPEFEIFRFHYQNNREAMLKISRGTGSRRKDSQNWGETETEGGLRFWIGPKPLIRGFLEPLNEDGSGIVSELARTESTKKGVDPFFEILTGTRKGERYLILTVARSEPLARLISQRMTVRLLQVDEIFYRVF